MSLFPDLTPLINQIKEFNQNQQQTNALLKEILLELRKEKNNMGRPLLT